MSETFTIKKRVQSIDLLRGFAIIVMALDHTRNYFSAEAMVFAPLDLAQTNVPLFFTRWITHFCAPVFMFLAGTSAFLVQQRKTKKELSFYLVMRGLFLVFLELTVVNFGWTFNIHFPFFVLGVIWALGISMIVLSILIYFPYSVIFAIGTLLIAGHNLLDTIHVPGNTFKAFIWSCLHDPTLQKESSQLIIKGHSVIVDYPVLPWIGVVALGYCFGNLYKPGTNVLARRKKLIILGCGAILLFILLRLLNVYGDPYPWATQKSTVFTVLSFLKVTKYPPSLQFILLTTGPAILFLAVAEKYLKDFGKAIIKIGRVPMFFYLLHIYLIHAFAMIAANLTGYHLSDMVSHVPLTPKPKGFGFPLPVVYIVWLIVILILYPLCKWYDNYKSLHKEKWWLSYL
jgi:uncharacterized membrane protein